MELGQTAKKGTEVQLAVHQMGQRRLVAGVAVLPQMIVMWMS